MAKTCYFYNLSPDQYWSLDVETEYILWESITIIEAQNMLHKITLADFPNMKDGDRNKIHKKLYRQGYPATFRESVELTPEALARALGG